MTRPDGAVSRASQWVLVVMTLLLCGLAYPAYYVGYFGDDAIYLLLAKSLAETGRYRAIWFPGESAYVTHPPGYPLLLAPLARFFGTQILPVKLLSIFLSGASSVLVFRLALRSLGSPRLAWIATVLAVASPIMLQFSSTLMSEVPYLFFSLLALWVASRREATERVPTLRGALVTAIIVTLPTYIRSAGLALLVAFLIGLLVRKRWRETLISAGTALFLLAPLLLRGQPGVYTGASAHFFSPSSLAAASGFYLSAAAALLGNPFWGEHSRAVTLLLFLPWPIIGFWKSVRTSPGLMEGYLALYGVGLLIYPVLDDRFLHPVLPLLMIYACHGMASMWPAGRGRLSRIVRGAVVGCAVLAGCGMLWGSVRVLRDARWSMSSLNEPQRATYEWIRSHSSAEEIIMSDLPPRVYLFTGRQGVAFPPPASATQMVRAIAGQPARLILLHPSPVPSLSSGSPLSSAGETARAVRAMPRKFPRVYANEKEGTEVYEVAFDRARVLEAYRWLERGYRLFQTGKYREAIGMFRSARERDPTLSEARQLLAASLERTGDRAAALRELLALTAEEPRFLRGRLSLALLYLETGRRREGLRELREAERLAEAQGELTLLPVIREELIKRTEKKRP